MTSIAQLEVLLIDSLSKRRGARDFVYIKSGAIVGILILALCAHLYQACVKNLCPSHPVRYALIKSPSLIADVIVNHAL